ncbi:unnamed protein product [Fusarium graminearum]|uniref:Uncharacterized protein n=1 Tax=Gibberella zeae TaxID=5518 RepID=A0A2H3FUH0_GIBZA|nr:hypothetical protein FGRA07_04275 [Fusarium graminearum]CAF3563964.1 unnamed protein product [Fusarium graminearum]CAG1962896.1 unnamed protein product [Fusarium graminearum]CAG1984049.1 unnamed protein product [Fusarium graminearum]CAG1999598.1 unnamed protein product [Fusarium graminearum]
MGRPKPRRALSASRFQEGSMNDRTSAAPPVQFLGPEELAALERPALTYAKSNNARPMSDDFSDKQVKKGRLLGQVWDEVRGRLGFRKDNEDDRGLRKRSRSRKRDQDDQRGREREREDIQMMDMPDSRNNLDPPRDDMPSREEILANYHHLMASGFFTSHAIQSTRQPPPGAVQQAAQQIAAPPADLMDALSRTPTSQGTAPPPPTPPVEPRSPLRAKFPLKLQSPPGNPGAATYEELVASGFFTPPLSAGASPPTPFGAAPSPAVPTGIVSKDHLHPPRQTRGSRTGTPSASCATSPIQSPASVSSRGTKRAAADSNSDAEAGIGAHDSPTPKKKLRKTSSRDIGLHSLRNVASRRSLLSSRRSVSGPHGAGAGKDYNKLARRVLGRLPGAGGRSSFDLDRRAGSRPGSAARNSTEESRSPLQEVQYARVLRSRKIAAEEPHTTLNGNKGIPVVPDIPHKFALHDNAENLVPAMRSRY